MVMENSKKPAKKKSVGQPLPKIRDDYVDPAPTPEEVDGLVALWDAYAPSQYQGLLRAQNKTVLEQNNQKPTGGFIWDDQRGQYIEVSTGRALSRMEVHRALSQFVQAYSSR